MKPTSAPDIILNVPGPPVCIYLGKDNGSNCDHTQPFRYTVEPFIEFETGTIKIDYTQLPNYEEFWKNQNKDV